MNGYRIRGIWLIPVRFSSNIPMYSPYEVEMMPPQEKTPKNLVPNPDPVTDLLICRTPDSPPDPSAREGDGTLLYAHRMPGGPDFFYLSYRIHPFDPPVIRLFDSPTDAAAFIRGAAGQELLGIPPQDRHRIRKYFPEWFGLREGDDRDPTL